MHSHEQDDDFDPKRIVAYLVYSSHPTKTAALDALGAAIAEGRVTERLVYHCGIKQVGALWHVVVKLN